MDKARTELVGAVRNLYSAAGNSARLTLSDGYRKRDTAQGCVYVAGQLMEIVSRIDRLGEYLMDDDVLDQDCVEPRGHVSLHDPIPRIGGS